MSPTVPGMDQPAPATSSKPVDDFSLKLAEYDLKVRDVELKEREFSLKTEDLETKKSDLAQKGLDLELKRQDLELRRNIADGEVRAKRHDILLKYLTALVAIIGLGFPLYSIRSGLEADRTRRRQELLAPFYKAYLDYLFKTRETHGKIVALLQKEKLNQAAADHNKTDQELLAAIFEFKFYVGKMSLLLSKPDSVSALQAVETELDEIVTDVRTTSDWKSIRADDHLMKLSRLDATAITQMRSEIANWQKITTVQILEELIKLAKDIRTAHDRGEEAGLSDEEIAFYDALAENESARAVMGEPQLRVIAHELVASIKNTVTVDWMHRDAARARMRVLVKKILRKYGYPPDLQDAAVQNVLQQAEALSAEWSGIVQTE